MRAILPGRPQSRRQALATADWDGLRLVSYVTSNAAVVFTSPHTLLQTIYIDTEALLAVAIDEETGRIAICDEEDVYIYVPIGRDEGALTWMQAHVLTADETATVTSISWTSTDELVIGGSELKLFYLAEHNQPRCVWRQEIAYPTSLAYPSYDGGLIASCGHHDRLVKIWRRISYEVDSTRFDVAYLSHPGAITNVHWRKPWHVEQNLDNVLYTFCADNHVRIWAYKDPHDISIIEQIAEIDMTATIQPRRLSIGSISRRRYAFIIDSRDFSSATEKAVQNTTSKDTDHALEHLIEIANRSPEICIVLDGLGHMSAWGLENAGYKSKAATEVFNVVHVDDFNIVTSRIGKELDDYTQFCIFAGGSTKSSLSVLAHTYDGAITWYETSIARFFDTAPRSRRVQTAASWSGHDDTILQIWQDEQLVSKSESEVIRWTRTGNHLEVHSREKTVHDLQPNSVHKTELKASYATTQAVANERRLVIWDGLSNTFEYEVELDDAIQCLEWTCTSLGRHPLLAVATTFNITLFVRVHQQWLVLQESRIREYTSHSIGDICFLDDDSLVIAAGNQLIVLDIQIGEQQAVATLGPALVKNLSPPGVIDFANAALPLYHPVVLRSLLRESSLSAIMNVMLALNDRLKFYSNGDAFSVDLGLSLEALVEPVDLHQDEVLGTVQQLSNRLAETGIPYVKHREQDDIRMTLKTVERLLPLERSVDSNGLRYLHALYTEEVVSWRAIMFASLSTSQDILVDKVTVHNNGKLTWEAARKSGLFLWLSASDASRAQLENVGRAEYTQNEDRNPVDCSLYYLALGKKKVLQGLWRTAIGVRERNNTIKLLANNFDDPKWKATALKNAYALISRRRFEYAAAFFLLGGSLRDAVSVLAHQVKDLQLAFAVARAYQKDDESVLRDLLHKVILPAAVTSIEGRWMASWTYTQLREPSKAVQVLVRHVHEVVGVKVSVDQGSIPVSLGYETNESTLAVLYSLLRNGLIKKDLWSNVLHPTEEWDFVMRCARYVVRTGCDVLALRLVREWTFIESSSGPKQQVTVEVSTAAGTMADTKAAAHGEPRQADKKKPTQFIEPSADSLLDSFGF